MPLKRMTSVKLRQLDAVNGLLNSWHYSTVRQIRSNRRMQSFTWLAGRIWASTSRQLSPREIPICARSSFFKRFADLLCIFRSHKWTLASRPKKVEISWTRDPVPQRKCSFQLSHLVCKCNTFPMFRGRLTHTAQIDNSTPSCDYGRRLGLFGKNQIRPLLASRVRPMQPWFTQPNRCYASKEKDGGEVFVPNLQSLLSCQAGCIILKRIK
jgi:hypothetical protein